MRLKKKARTALEKYGGYIILIIQDVPGLGIWVGFMSIPLLLYLITLVGAFPYSIASVVFTFFVISGYFIFERVLIIVGLSIFLYSTYFLRKEQRNGLVTTGPYKYVRHPQYLGILLFTIGLTSWSFVIAATTYGVTFWQAILGFYFDPIKIWYAEFVLYILVALIEETHLTKKFGEEYKKYRVKTPFLIPGIKFRGNLYIQIIFAGVVLLIFLYGTTYSSLSMLL